MGDCAGNLHLRSDFHRPTPKIYPIFNHVHGLKLDWFMENVCLADYVFITDDDVFLLNPEPLRWAFMQNASRSQYRRGVPNAKRICSFILAGASYAADGLLLFGNSTRHLAKKRISSFKVVRSPSKERIYDTLADLVNVLLLQRGYDVVIAPEKLREQITSFEGISQWTLENP